MGRSKKRKRRNGEHTHVDGGILPSLYPSSHLCTLYDLLLALLLPSLQHIHAPPSSPLSSTTKRTAVGHAGLRQAPKTAAACAVAQHMAKVGAGQSTLADMGLSMRMWQATVDATMGQTMAAADMGASTDMQQATMGSNMGVQQATVATGTVARHEQSSKVAMYMDACQSIPAPSVGACQAASAPSGGAWQEAAATAGVDTSKQQAAVDDAALVSAVHSLLVREGDPADYLFLLYHGYGVLPNSVPPLGRTMLEQRWTHQQVIERVIQILFKQGKNSLNVLCFGFQQPRPRSSWEREKTAPAGLACVSDNAAVTVLNSQTWRTIHARVGDLIMLHLLSYADIFHPLPHKCYVQVAGTSVLLSAQPTKFPEKWAFPTTRILIDKQGTSWKKRRIVTLNDKDSKGGSAGVDSQMDVRSRHCVSNASIHQKVTSRKRQRPHSWQRRKAKRLNDKQAEQDNAFNVVKARRVHFKPGEQELTVEASELCHANSVDFIEAGPATQGEFVTVLGDKAVTLPKCQNDNKSHSGFQVLGLGKFNSSDEGKNDWQNMPISGLSSQQKLSCSAASINEQPNGVTKEKHQRMAGFSSRPLFTKLVFGTQQQQALKASNRGKFGTPPARACNTNSYCVGIGAGRRLINRTRMFYKAKFPHHARLPKNHILQRLRPRYKDVAVLFEAIFGKESLCRSNNAGQCCFVCSKICSKCICCLLKKLISNGRSCQFARLLKRHCSPSVTRLLQTTLTQERAKNLHLKAGMQSKRHANHDEECTVKCRSKGVANHADPMQGNCQKHAGKGFDGSGKVLAEERNNDFCSHSQVVAFIWAVCRRIVPEELLGSKKNWRNLRKNIFAFVSLRRHESFSLEQCMFKLTLSGYPWYQKMCLDGCCLSKEVLGEFNVPKVTEDDSSSSFKQQNEWELSDHTRVGSAGGCQKKRNFSFQILKRTMLEKWIYWLFSGLIVPLIQAHFYVTESEKYKQTVLFYRKSVWAKIKAGAVKEMMKCNFKRLSAQATGSLLKQGSLGFSRARLLPKKAGMRLIANLGSSSLFPIVNNTCKEARRTGNVSKKRGNHGNLFKSRARNAGRTEIRRDRMGLTFKPINLVLRDLHQCLKYEQEKHGEDLGCSVFDYNDAYLKLLPYIIDHKRVSNAVSPLYLVVCDVLQAFDTIKQDKLVEIVQEFVREEEFCVRRYGYVSPNMKSIKVYHERSATSTGNGMTSLDIFLQLAAKQRSAVCVDQAYSIQLKRSHIFEVIKEHIQRNILQIGQHYYLQVVGIPQGSVLSSLLCSLYYGHFERSRLACSLHLQNGLTRKKQVSIGTNMAITLSGLIRADSTRGCLKPEFSVRSTRSCLVNHSVRSSKCFFLQSNGAGDQPVPSPLSCKNTGETFSAAITENAEPRNIMLRLVDDWLFISNSQDDALEFVRKMHRGFVEYNCVANRLKTAVSFDAVIGKSALNMNVYRTQDEACYIRWSGLLINCNTLEVQADYTRYCGVDIRSTLTVWRKNNQGYYLMTKLCQFMRPKCHPIFYDANINSPATVFLNAYQAFLLCAMKFHAYNRSLPCRSRCNPEFGFKAIQKCARYMHSLLAHRTRKISKSAPVKPLLLLHVKETRWLALCAFHKVLMRKQSRYARLLYLIKTELKCPKYNELGETPLMLSALDARRSSMFEDIIY